MVETASNNMRAFRQSISPITVGKHDEQSYRLDLAMEWLEVEGRNFCVTIYEERPSGLQFLSIVQDDGSLPVGERRKPLAHLQKGPSGRPMNRLCVTVPTRSLYPFAQSFEFPLPENPYKELCTGRRLIKSSIYNSALQGKQLLILAEADIADRNVHVGFLTIPVPEDSTPAETWSKFRSCMQRLVTKLHLPFSPSTCSPKLHHQLDFSGGKSARRLSGRAAVKSKLNSPAKHWKP